MKTLRIFCVIVLVMWGVAFVINNSLHVIKPGYRAAVETLGAVADRSYENGPVWVFPFVTEVIPYDVKEQKYDFAYKLKTANMQNVLVSGAINYNLNGDRVHILHQYVGKDYQKVMIEPLLEGVLTQTVGKNDPAFLVNNMEMVTEAVSYIIKDELAQVDLLNTRDIKLFKPEFSEELEAAYRDAEVAKVATQRVEQEAQQMLLKAQSEGKALELKSNALKNPLIVQYEVAKALGSWSGNLPSTLVLGDNALPMLPLGK